VAALADVELSAADVDGIVRSDKDTVAASDLIQSLGMRLSPTSPEVGPGGNAPSASIGQAVGAIVWRQATTVLVFRALNGRSGKRLGEMARELLSRRGRCIRRALQALPSLHRGANFRPSCLPGT